MSLLELALEKQIGKNNLTKIQSYKIGIAGTGGLGSNCAFNLVRSGFKIFTIVDFDKVDASNLNRQFYFENQIGITKVEALKENLLKINPSLIINPISLKITKDNITKIFDDCDVIVEAFDKAEDKILITQKFSSSGKLLVVASGLAGWGNSDEIVTTKIHDKFFLVGDNTSEVTSTLPPISPRVNIAAAKQADIILTYVLSN